MELARTTPPHAAVPLRLVRGATAASSYSALIEQAQQAELQGRRPDARHLYETALCRLREAPHGSDASDVLRWIARTHRVDADLDLALECAEAALAIAEAHAHRAAAGHATNLLAIIRWQQGDLDEAERLYNVARASALHAGEAKLGAMTAQNLGVIANIRGDLLTALHHYEASLAAYRKLGLASDVCVALNNLGLLHTQCQRWAEASCAYDEAMRVAEVLGDQSTRMYIEVNRAEWSVAQGDFAAARHACERAVALVVMVKDAPAVGELHKAFGIVERETGDYARAEEHLALAHSIAAARQDMLLLADTTKELAELHRRQGRNRDALQCLNRAHRYFSQLRARRELADVDRRMSRLEGDFLDVVRRWGESIECNDDYTQGHCERVADIACDLAARDGMDEQSLFWFRIGALLHDVGKLVIPPAVLNKRGQLTEDEWSLMRSHPMAGVTMMADVEFPWDVSPILEGHHERWNGSGYPHGLAGEAIPRVARMVCIADVYDALTSERSYKKGMSHDAAIEVMRADAGVQFDPVMFALFEEVAHDRSATWMAPRRAVAPHRQSPPHVGAPQADELTGLSLRRAFNEAGRAALASGSPDQMVSLLVVDVDHFKSINDTYGHLQGDNALRVIARVLREAAPQGAFVGRYAGDEFVILLPRTGIDVAMATAERVRLAAHAIPVALEGMSPVALTLSIGVASTLCDGTSVESLFAAADAALYDAKRHGRDAVAHPKAARIVPPRPQLGTFIARDGERRRLVELLTRAAAGSPQVVSIVGEAGVGKSSLARALESDVRILAGSLVAGRCADSATPAPYWPWASAIGAIRALRLVPARSWRELPRLSPMASVSGARLGENRLALCEEVAEFLRLATAARPLVLVLDDMQWADGASWELLEYVVARLDRERLLICLTLRDEEWDGEVLLRRARVSRDERFHELRLDRLGQPDIARWITQAFEQDLPEQVVAHVYRMSEGNPFFAVQVLGSMMDSGALRWVDQRWHWQDMDNARVPTAVKDVLGRRLARLSANAARVLSAAAVTGRCIDLDIAISAGIATEEELLDAIDEGIAARVLEPSTIRGDDGVTFCHGLLVEVLHQQIHPRRLRRLHEQVERALDEQRYRRLARQGEGPHHATSAV